MPVLCGVKRCAVIVSALLGREEEELEAKKALLEVVVMDSAQRQPVAN